MTNNDPTTDLDAGRTWLNRAASALNRLEDSSPESVAYAHAAAMTGHGFVALAHAARSFEAMDSSAQMTARQIAAIDALTDEMLPAATLGEAIEREKRAAAEARPHDDELVPVPCPRCEGCGQLADTDDREPWTAWESLPPGADLAVKAGLVKPVPCDQCDGKKTVLRPGGDRG